MFQIELPDDAEARLVVLEQCEFRMLDPYNLPVLMNTDGNFVSVRITDMRTGIRNFVQSKVAVH